MRRRDISEASLRTLLRNGDVAMVHQLLAYICDQIHETAYVFRQLVPQLEDYGGRVLRECAFDYGPYSVQRARFLLFEYLARFVTRRLVAEAVTAHSNWYPHVAVYNVENDIMGEWYDWFEQSGIFVGDTVGFLDEAKRHYRKVRDIVQQWSLNE